MTTTDNTVIISVDLIESFRRSDNKPENWTDNNAETAFERYRKFLFLAAKYKHQPVAPTHDIDVMWHLHMLSPRAYFHDCMRLFGDIFDHDGGFGKGEGELSQLQDVFSTTENLWRLTFNEPYLTANEVDANGLVKCWHDCQSRCWHACKSITHSVAA